MKAESVDDGVQVETESGFEVLVTVRHHPDYGFKGSVVTKDKDGHMRVVEFHGDGFEGVAVHPEEDFTVTP